MIIAKLLFSIKRTFGAWILRHKIFDCGQREQEQQNEKQYFASIWSHRALQWCIMNEMLSTNDLQTNN